MNYLLNGHKINRDKTFNRLLTAPFRWLSQISLCVLSAATSTCLQQLKPWAVVSKFFTLDRQTKFPLWLFPQEALSPTTADCFLLSSMWLSLLGTFSLSLEGLCSPQLPWSRPTFPIALSQPSPAPAGPLFCLPTPYPSCLQSSMSAGRPRKLPWQLSSAAGTVLSTTGVVEQTYRKARASLQPSLCRSWWMIKWCGVNCCNQNNKKTSFWMLWTAAK